MEKQELITTDDLTDLARQIATLRQPPLARAIEVGVLLQKAKPLVPYGHWEKWLAENCSVSPRACQQFMQLAENREQAASAKTVKAALKLIAKAKPAAISVTTEVAPVFFMGDTTKLEVLEMRNLSQVEVALRQAIRPCLHADGKPILAVEKREDYVSVFRADHDDTESLVIVGLEGDTMQMAAYVDEPARDFPLMTLEFYDSVLGAAIRRLADRDHAERRLIAEQMSV